MSLANFMPSLTNVTLTKSQLLFCVDILAVQLIFASYFWHHGCNETTMAKMWTVGVFSSIYIQCLVVMRPNSTIEQVGKQWTRSNNET